jgi:exopolyphosphatase/guanosine-5'-triphosphate,3'-diphosphate pyrophosphatase
MVHGHVLSESSIETWFEKMVSVTSFDRIKNFGLRPLRADVFPAGIAILLGVMNHMNVSEITVSANGLRVGAALATLINP